MTENSRFAATKGTAHADALAPGTRLAEFEILSVLGMGGFGVVYKAFDHSLHRTVAIKEYLPLALAGRQEGLSVSVRTLSDEVAFQSGLKSFVDEARLLAQFDHPALVKVFRFWEAHNTAYMVMPLYNGMTLKQARAQMRTPPPEAWLRQVLWSVLGALRMLHESHTLHRDISPDNIFLQDVGPPVLLDLGAARHAINDRDHKHTAVLKVNYAPIEQYTDGDTDLPQGPWSDLYALAAVVHGCLCNDTPLPSTLRSIRDRMVPFAQVAKTVRSQFGQEYSPALVSAIAQSLALRPQDRPQSIDAFLQTMGMVSPPPGLGHFDFRAELGDIWVEPTDQPGPGFIAPTVDLTNALVEPLSERWGPLGLGTPVLNIPAVRQPSQGADVPFAASIPAQAAAVLSVPLRAAVSCAPAVVSASGARTLGVADPDPAHGQPTAVATEKIPGAVFLKVGEGVLRDGGAIPQGAAVGGTTFRPSGPARQERPLRTWRAAMALSLVVMAALTYGWMGSDPVQPSRDDTVITEMAEPPEVAPAPASAMPSASAPAALARPAGTASLSDLAAAGAPALAPAGPPPAFVEVSAKPEPPQRTAKTAAPPPQRPASTLAAAPPSPRALVAAHSRARPATGLCADTNFFTRSACVYSECAKRANTAVPLCVEHRNRLQKQANSILGN
ncbi:MAG: serine/threonine-protein kinase [Simplicispira sp.]|nr:serine/threonine-protein kinase [Simplicispira sp.]